MIDHEPWPAGTGINHHHKSGRHGSTQSPAPVTGDGRRQHRLTGVARKKWPPAGTGAALIVGSAIAFALDGPVAQAAYQQDLDPAAFGFWRASAGAMLLGGCLAARLRSATFTGIRRMRRATAIRLALAAMAGLGLNLALFEAFARLPVAVAVAAFGCYPLFVAVGEAVSRRFAGGAVTVGLAAVAIAGLLLLIRPDRSASASTAGVLLALLAAVLHAAYILLGRRGWDQAGDGAATFMIVATAALGLGAMAAATRPAAVLAPASDLGLTGLLLLDGALAGAAAPLLFLAGLRRIGATRTAMLSLCEPLAATLLAAAMFGQLLAPSQLLGGALLLGAGIAVQTIPIRPGRPARDGPRSPHRHPSGNWRQRQRSDHMRHGRDQGNQDDHNEAQIRSLWMVISAEGARPIAAPNDWADLSRSALICVLRSVICVLRSVRNNPSTPAVPHRQPATSRVRRTRTHGALSSASGTGVSREAVPDANCRFLLRARGKPHQEPRGPDTGELWRATIRRPVGTARFV